MVDTDHACTEDVMESSKTAEFLVYDGEPITTGEAGEPTFASPIYTSPYFYTK